MYFNVGTDIIRNAYSTFGYERDYVPEQASAPPEDDEYITADCGHEVYGGECVYEPNDGGETLCPDCMEEMANSAELGTEFDKLYLWQQADLLGYDFQRVMFDEGW